MRGLRATEEVDQVVKYLPCPVCSGFMLRKNFGGCSGIVIDWCKGHGFWFDGSELEKVMVFINSGGPRQIAPAGDFAVEAGARALEGAEVGLERRLCARFAFTCLVQRRRRRSSARPVLVAAKVINLVF
jgi:Zn-finger nucleic acid-binding protein